MPMAHQPLAAVFGVLVSVAAEEGCDLGLDSLRQQRSRALAQNFGERIGEGFWLNQLGNIILDHGVSLLWWRSGGSNTPTIRRLNPSPRHQLPRIPRRTDRPSFRRRGRMYRLPHPLLCISCRSVWTYLGREGPRSAVRCKDLRILCLGALR